MAKEDPNSQFIAEFETLKETIERNFKAYQKDALRSKLPPVERLWNDYKSRADLWSFLKVVLQSCRNLMRDEKFKTGELRQKLADGLESLRESIGRLGLLETDTALIDKWFAFNISRLHKFERGLEDYQHLYDWLRTCHDSGDNEIAHFFIFFDLSRDEEMRHIVFDDSGRVRTFFRDPASPGRVYLPKLATWFLARYDLDASFIILNTLNAHSDVRVIAPQKFKLGGDIWRRLLWPVFWFSCAMTVFLLLGSSGSLHVRMFETFGVGLMPRWSPTIESPRVQTWIMLPYLAFALIALLYFINWIRRGWYNQARKLLPRLFGGILIGYIPLMSSEDVWKWMLTMPVLSSVFIWLLAMGFSYLYLYAEARNTLSDGEMTAVARREIIIRAAQVFMIGLAEAYVIGLILCELLGFTALSGLIPAFSGDATYYVIKGWIGTLVPRVILLYAPLALFLGILVQLIWEEKTVTQPL